MMKYYILLFSSVLLLTFSSCKKLVDIQETDVVTDSIAYKYVLNCEQGIIGAYAGMSTDMDILLNSTFADEVKPAEFYNSTTTHEWQYSTTDVTIRDNFTAITPNYTIIDRVNRVLAALPKADSTRPGDLALKSRLRGEALFMRAYAHFELFRYYCNNYHPDSLAMPYMEIVSLDEQERIKQGLYFQKMVRDITEAKTLLPSLVPLDAVSVNRATKSAAAALQARIALYMKDWVNAEAYATEFINVVPLASRADFADSWKDVNVSELAFRIVKTATSAARMGSLFRGTSSISSGKINIGTITWMPSDKLWNSYDQTNDIRFTAYLKNEPLLVAPRPSHIIQKYAGTSYGSGSENVANAKVFRTGEMYLIRAEARAEQNKFTGAGSAESDINDLRTARITAYVPVVFASKDDAITAIMQERFKELPFEGHRFWDLKRRGLPVERLASDAPSATAMTLPANNFRFTLPIPDWEIKANKLMVQNTGYF